MYQLIHSLWKKFSGFYAERSKSSGAVYAGMSRQYQQTRNQGCTAPIVLIGPMHYRWIFRREIKRETRSGALLGDGVARLPKH
jgi:hypothetical protein